MGGNPLSILRLTLLTLAATSLVGWGSTSGTSGGDPNPAPLVQPNILFVNIDDINYTGGGYYPDLSTPNLDRMAAEGTKFSTAHTNSPMCNPSRVAMLMGISPATSGILQGNSSQFDWRSSSNGDILKAAKSWPQHFMDEGYRAVGTGKLWQNQQSDDDSDHELDVGYAFTNWDDYQHKIDSFSVTDGAQAASIPAPGVPNYAGPDGGITGLLGNNYSGPGIANGWDYGIFEFNNPGVDDEASHPDYLRTSYAITQVQGVGGFAEPVFVSLGIFRPHIPLYCPEKYFDTLPDPVTSPPYLATDVDDITSPMYDSFHFDELVQAGIVEQGDPNHYRNQNLRAYLACIQFADAMLGRVLDEVDASGEEWLVVVWGDHGLMTAEKDRLDKFVMWNQSTRTTLLMYGQNVLPDTVVDQAVTLIDVFPTIADMAGVSLLPGQEGRSLYPLMIGSDETTSIRQDFINRTDGVLFTAYKSKDWDYITNGTTSDTEFYNLNSDPNEWVNLDHPSNGGPNPIYDSIKTDLMTNATP